MNLPVRNERQFANVLPIEQNPQVIIPEPHISKKRSVVYEALSLTGAVALGILNGTPNGAYVAIRTVVMNIFIRFMATKRGNQREISYSQLRVLNNLSRERNSGSIINAKHIKKNAYLSFSSASIINTISCSIILNMPLKYATRIQTAVLSLMTLCSNEEIPFKTKLTSVARFFVCGAVAEILLPHFINILKTSDGIVGDLRNSIVAATLVIILINLIKKKNIETKLEAVAIASLTAKIIGFKEEVATELSSQLLALMGGLQLAEGAAYGTLRILEHNN